MEDSLLTIKDEPFYEANLIVNNNKPSAATATTSQSSVNDLKDLSYLPVGKALHLLLKVKTHVLITAITLWKKKKDISTQHNSPILTALLSLDNYIKTVENVDNVLDSSLQLIYTPLKEKMLKSRKNESQTNIYQLLMGLFFYSDYSEQYQTLIKRELQHSDKRNNLAGSLLLSFIMKQIVPSFVSNDTISIDIKKQLEILSFFIPDLYRIVEQYSDTPTLLVCTTYDTLLSLSSTMIMSFFKEESKQEPNKNGGDNKRNNSSLITIINKNNRMDHQQIKIMQHTWVYIIKLLSIAKSWQQSHDMITECAWKELDIFLKTCQSILIDSSSKDEYQQVAISWYWISNHIHSTQLLSKKQKKVNSILHLKNKHLSDYLSNYLKFLLLTLLQKGEWLSQVITKQNDDNNYADDDSFEKIKIICKALIENYPMPNPWHSINQQFIPFIYGIIPTFSTLCNVIPTIPIILCICQFPWSDPIYASSIDHDILVSNIANYFVLNPQESSSILLKKLIEPILSTTDDESTVFFYLEIISGMVALSITNRKNPSIICEQLAYDLLGCVCHSNKCCEIMIQCMPFIHLTSLIRSLMTKLIQTKDDRSNQVTKGLIAKALLVDHWCDDSVLLYIDLIRDYLKYQPGTPFEYGTNIMKSSSPKDIYLTMDTQKKTIKTNLSENEEMELLWPIQLWSSRANEKSLEKTISLLVEKFYDAPNEMIFIRTWQMLTLAMINHEHLVLIVLEKCAQLLEAQNNLYDSQFYNVIQDNAMIYILIVPLLILRVFPEKVYNNVRLTSFVIEKWKDTWPLAMEQVKMTQYSDSTTGIYVRLANALLFRYNITKNMTSFERIHQLTKDIICKIFQQQ